jgi:hypothetical protein
VVCISLQQFAAKGENLQKSEPICNVTVFPISGENSFHYRIYLPAENLHPINKMEIVRSFRLADSLLGGWLFSLPGGDSKIVFIVMKF